MDNIIKFEPQNNVLSNQEIETLFKGLIKLVEKNTEQKLKNAGSINNKASNASQNSNVYNFSSAISNINSTKYMKLNSVNDIVSQANKKIDNDTSNNVSKSVEKSNANDSISQDNVNI